MINDSEALAFPLVFVRSEARANAIRLLVALLVGVTGVCDMCAVLYPRFPLAVLLDYWPLDFDIQLRSFAVIIGFGLIVLARGLARGKRHAWQVTIGLLGLSLLWQMTRGHVALVMGETVLLGGMLGAAAPYFRARSDAPSVQRGYLALLGGALIVYLYALGGTLVLEHRFAPVGSVERVFDSLTHLIDDAPLLRAHLTHTARVWIFERSLAMVTLTAFIYGLAAILRPAITAFQVSHSDRATAVTLVRQWGENSLAAFALAPEKRYFIAPEQEGVVAYVMAEGMAVVAGDPIAAPERMPVVLAAFDRWRREHDLSAAFWQTRAAYLPYYRQLGYQSLKIGEEAIIDLAGFTLKGGAMQNVRSSMRHAEKAGVTARFFTGHIDDPLLALEVEALSLAWLAAKGGEELGFSMGRSFDTYLTDRQIAVAVDDAGHALAFTTYVPVYGRQGWALDMMRRSAHTPAGTMELLLTRAIERFRDAGACVLSLGLAPLANTAQEPVTNIGQICALFSNRFGSNKQAASLMNFKRKFAPRWEPRYIVYPGTLALPRVGLAFLSAHLCRSWRTMVRWRAFAPARSFAARVATLRPGA